MLYKIFNLIKVVIFSADKVTVIIDKNDYDIKLADLITMKNILNLKNTLQIKLKKFVKNNLKSIKELNQNNLLILALSFPNLHIFMVFLSYIN